MMVERIKELEYQASLDKAQMKSWDAVLGNEVKEIHKLRASCRKLAKKLSKEVSYINSKREVETYIVGADSIDYAEWEGEEAIESWIKWSEE